LIQSHPKIFMGYSDVTVLCNAIFARTGLTTFYPLSVLVDLAEFPSPLSYTVASFMRTLCVASPPGELSPAMEWTEELLDWESRQDLTRPRIMQASPGWTWLKAGVGAGPLVGGCLESLQHLRGTPYWPPMDGAIWFWETSEERPSPGWVDAVLQDYDNMGVLANLQGMLIGRPYGYDDEQRAEIHAIILERTQAYTFPIIADMDFGHTAPQMLLPIGCRAEIETSKHRFSLVEAAVKAP
jgi:muramoyltetrapeptide carboxypeptidase